MDLTESMSRFRLAGRELFNNFFRVPDPYVQNGWTLAERFAAVEEVLFAKLVSEPAALERTEYGRLQPEVAVTVACGSPAPAMINRVTDSGYWDYPVEAIGSDADLRFVSFFDWDSLTVRDSQFVRVRIMDWPSHPEAVGKDALLEAQHVKYVKIGRTEASA